MFYLVCLFKAESSIAQAGLGPPISKDHFELPILPPYMNAGCISALHLMILFSAHLWKDRVLGKQKPLSVCFLLSVPGLAHLLMVPQKLRLRVLGGTVDCQVAPTETAVYDFISHTFLSVSPAQMGQKSEHLVFQTSLQQCSAKSHTDIFLCRAAAVADSLGMGTNW